MTTKKRKTTPKLTGEAAPKLTGEAAPKLTGEAARKQLTADVMAAFEHLAGAKGQRATEKALAAFPGLAVRVMKAAADGLIVRGA